MKQEFEWHEVADGLPTEKKSYLVIRDTGSYGVVKFDGFEFHERYKRIIAWADIPDASHLVVMTNAQQKLVEISEQIRMLQKERDKLLHTVWHEAEHKHVDKIRYNRSF